MVPELPQRIDYLAELCAIYRLEKLAQADLEEKISQSTDEFLKAALEKHLQFTYLHLERIQRLFADLELSDLLENNF
ncbi:DUF892 family protein [Flavobacterium sp.]|uniref:DUF892 family protein n=1 Tax=Flavobacterium sp. TaxID=239 RepID=UPI002606A31C|nr:DUF892 family protein [Flavobacterium sp.]